MRDPPTFRGENSDSVTLEEWIELMQTFIKKGGLSIGEQGEEILIHLRGKAKDVVKVGIKSSGVDIRHSPASIYSLLRKHFSCKQFSPLPLQDFYTTFPEPREDPFDYWLRLNSAADIAAECLLEQGKQQDSLSIEVTRMFIRNCPDSGLLLTFRSKTIDKWSAAEVQEVLDEYHSEKVIKAAGVGKDGAVGEKNVAVNRMEVKSSPAPLCSAQATPQSTSADHSALERMIGMMEKVLMNTAQRIEGQVAYLVFKVLKTHRVWFAKTPMILPCPTVRITDCVSSVFLLTMQGTDVHVGDRVQHPVARRQTNRSACGGGPRRL